jgi:hypothetical protein
MPAQKFGSASVMRRSPVPSALMIASRSSSLAELL